MSKYLIVGLGNIGSEYANTRHNIGFDVTHAFAKKYGGEFRNDRLAFVAEVKFKGKPIICICPTTYLSGKAFKYWMDKEKIPLENTLTVVDEVALPLEKIRIRAAGSAGGHNGLKDIEATISSNAYPKLRFGVGNNYPKGMQADFVLGKWTPQEQPLITAKIQTCVEAIEVFIAAGVQQAMTTFNHMSVGTP
jgi:peptidyl-tRNA hydrolase, PTH1 family